MPDRTHYVSEHHHVARVDLPVPFGARESAKAAGTPSAHRYPVSELSTALRRAWAIGSASVKSISATQAGRTSDGYVRHFALERRLNSARDTLSMAM